MTKSFGDVSSSAVSVTAEVDDAFTAEMEGVVDGVERRVGVAVGWRKLGDEACGFESAVSLLRRLGC